MAGLPTLQVGNAVAVSRQALLERLENLSAADRFQWEIRRRARLIESLETLRCQAAARQVSLSVPEEVANRTLQSLSGGIDLRPGELRVRFAGATDLASKLFELSQAMANDWNGFVAAVERQG
jgi:hypothetical protein